MSTHPVMAMNHPGMMSLPEEVATIKRAAVHPYRRLTIMNMITSTICHLQTR